MKNGDMYFQVHDTKSVQILKPFLNDKMYYFDNDFNLVEYELARDNWFEEFEIFKVKRFPNKLNVRKIYRRNDKVYCVKDRFLKYGIIRSKYKDNRYLVYFDDMENGLIPEHLIIPSDWWILHEFCKIGMYETSKCLLRLDIYLDLRILIAKYIWETRNDEEWGYPKCEEYQTFSSSKSFFQ
jgi:hypothetical protein